LLVTAGETSSSDVNFGGTASSLLMMTDESMVPPSFAWFYRNKNI
jgi:hypothetical protein